MKPLIIFCLSGQEILVLVFFANCFNLWKLDNLLFQLEELTANDVKIAKNFPQLMFLIFFGRDNFWFNFKSGITKSVRIHSLYLAKFFIPLGSSLSVSFSCLFLDGGGVSSSEVAGADSRISP